MMKALLIAFLLLVSTSTLVQARSGDEILGPFFGQVVAVDESQSEIMITNGNETESFKIKVPKEKEAYSGFTLAKVPVGDWVSFFYTEEVKSINKQKITVRTIVGLRMLGRNAYSILRTRLQVEESTPVERAPAEPLPVAAPVKIYLDLEDPRQRPHIVKWIENWNKKQAAKHVEVMIVNSPIGADVALVTYRIDPVRKHTAGMTSLTDAHGRPVLVGDGMEDFLSTRPTYAVFLAIPGFQKITVLSYRFNKTLNGWFLSSVTKDLEVRLLNMTPSLTP